MGWSHLLKLGLTDFNLVLSGFVMLKKYAELVTEAQELPALLNSH